MHHILLFIVAALLTWVAQAVNFLYETDQLTQSDIDKFPAIQFGDASLEQHKSECRAFPGSEDWPSETDWNSFNESLGGVLLNDKPPAAACYQGPTFDAEKCRFLVSGTGSTRFFLDNSATTLTQWPAGDTCIASSNPQGICTQGGFPVYVVNVTTVKHIQAGINFARNKNVRLIVKNTGHDFGGRSLGAGSISIWTHYLKSFEFLPEFTIGEYTGMAVRIGAGVEAWELFNYMVTYNITIVAPGGSTVGVGGGWLAVGGHGGLTSLYGLGADQPLSIQVVTADGRVVTADPFKNKDLFFALRGGGGSTYGIVSSVIFKAYPPINTTGSTLNLAYSRTLPTNTSGPVLPNAINKIETFWEALNLYFKFSEKVVTAGGICFNYIMPMPNNSYSFTNSFQLPLFEPTQAFNFVQPLYDDLNRIGINITNPRVAASRPYGFRQQPASARPINTRYRSRLFPRKNWEDDELFNKTMAVIRTSVEAGYQFHGIPHGPSFDTISWPAQSNAVNPAWRTAVMHASLMTIQPVGITAQQAKEEEARIQQYMQLWREVMPDSGAYMNEADPSEPSWQQSFFGDNYSRLLGVKRARDPWSVFWARTTVGSERWEVRTKDGYPSSQNGRLCLVK